MNASDPTAYTTEGIDSMSAPITNPLHLAPLEDKAILVDFDGGRLSSDGGLILLSDPDTMAIMAASVSCPCTSMRTSRDV